MASHSWRGRSNVNPQAQQTARTEVTEGSHGNAAAGQDIAPKKKGGILGWLQSAGDAVADTYHDVKDTVGGAIDATKTFATDAWDVVESTDVSWKDGTIGVETDLDEVMDLMPASYRERLKLGDDAENRMKMSFDTGSGNMNLSSEDLDIEAMDLGGLKTGAANFKGLNLNIGNATEAMGLFDNEGGVSVNGSVDSAHIQDLRMGEGESAISAAALNLTDFKGHGANGDGLPFGDSTSTSAGFSAANVRLSEFKQGNDTIDQVDLTDVAGGLSERDETAWLEMAKATAQGVHGAAGQDVGNSTATDIRVDIRNQDGGMVFVDDKDDHMQAHVTAGSADFNTIGATDLSVGNANVANVMADYNQDASSVEGTVGKAGVTQVRAGAHQLGAVNATGAAFKMGGGTTDVSAHNLNVENLKSEDLAVGAANADHARLLMKGDNTHISADALSVNEVTSGETHIGAATALQAAAHLNGDHTDVSAKTLTANDVTSGDIRLSRANATNAGAKLRSNSTTVSADILDVHDVQTGDIQIGEAKATLASAKIQGGTTDLAADTLGMTDFNASDFHAATVTAQQANASLSDDLTTGSVGSASVTDASIRDTLAIETASVTGVSGTIAGENRSTDVQSASVSGLTHLPTGSTIGSGSLQGIHGESKGDFLKASLDQGSLSDIQSGELSAAGTTVADLTYAGAPDQHTITSSAIGITDADYGELAHADSVLATGAQATLGKDGPSGVLKQLDASGLAFAAPSSSGGEHTDSGVDTGRLIRTLGQRVDHADVNVSVPMTAGEYKTGVGLDVEKDTQLDGHVSVRDNQLTDVNAQFSNPVDGPLWTSLDGLYTKDGAVRADVGGFWDQTISDDINETLGLEGKQLKSLGAYGNAVASQMAKPSTGAHETSGKPGLETAFDVDAMQLDAQAHLSAGTIDAGLGSVTLQDGGQNTNTVRAHSQQGGGVHVSADQIKASSLGGGLGDIDLSAGQTVIDGSTVTLDENGMSGSTDHVSVKDLSFE